MSRSGPRTVRKYSDEFKLTAVRLSQPPGLQVKTVAAALEIHPFMLSKWRKDVREGLIRGRAPKAPPPGPAREIAQLQALEKAYALLREEHELLKKGSSRNTGKCRSDLEEEVGVVAVAVGHALEDFDLVVDAFDEAGVEGIPTVTDDPGHVGRE
jgi:transposase